MIDNKDNKCSCGNVLDEYSMAIGKDKNVYICSECAAEDITDSYIMREWLRTEKEAK